MSRFIPPPERQKQIFSLLTKQERLSISEVVEQFSISEATARRDLVCLASQGKAQRVFGGVIAVEQAPPELPILERGNEQADEKTRIGHAASELISDGESVFLGSGTTVLEVARNLTERDLTVITNSLPVINLFAGKTNVTMIALGGSLRASELSFIGHITELSLAELRVDHVIIGTRAISVEQGLTNDYLPETLTDRATLNMGRKIVIVADHTKCGLVSTAYLASLSAVHTLVTDSGTAAKFITALRHKGIKVIVA
jgi:DeoR/GlpR family transcriptional regulator of sugar metabolism